jgi:hypothetical protein
MPATYDKIATTTLGSANNSIAFSSIPSTYTDLRIVLVAQSVSDNDTNMRLNGDTGNNYSAVNVFGNGTSAGTGIFNSISYIPIGQVTALPISPNWGLLTLDIFSYAGSTNKTCVSTFAQNKNGSGATESTISLWNNTSAITSINIYQAASGTFATGSTATLYGILKA